MKPRILLIILMMSALSCAGYLEEALDSPVIDGGEVTFRFMSRSARTVQVAGDWNNWGEGDAETGEVLVGAMLEAEREGVWELTVRLRPGRYRYRFLVDETVWALDPGNQRVTDDPKGGKANLLIVP